MVTQKCADEKIPDNPVAAIEPSVAKESAGLEFAVMKNSQTTIPMPLLSSNACFLSRLYIFPSGWERKIKTRVMTTVMIYCGPNVYFSANLATDAIKVPAMIDEMADQRDIFFTIIPRNSGIATGTPVKPKKMAVNEKMPYWL